MKTTGKIGRGLAAAGTIAALTAGGLLAAAPASAAETPVTTAAVQGDRVSGKWVSYTSGAGFGTGWVALTAPTVAANTTTYATQQAAIDALPSTSTFTWPATGTTGPIVFDATGLCMTYPSGGAGSTYTMSTCNGSAEQVFRAEEVADAGNQPAVDLRAQVAPSYASGIYWSPDARPKANGVGTKVATSKTVAIPAPLPVAITSPASGISVGTKGATFTGTAPANADVEITDADGKTVGTAKADSKGAWTATLQLPTGTTTLTFTVGEETDTWSGLVIDDTAEIVLSSPTAGSKVVGSGVLFEGTAEPGAEVKILDSEGNVVKTVTADATTGAFSVNVVLPEGSTSASVVVGERKIAVDNLAVVAELKVTKPAADATIGTNGTEFAGTGEPGDTVEIKDANGKTIGTTEVKPDGSWDLSVKVPEGAAPITIIADGQEIVLKDVEVVDDTAPLVIESPKAGDEIVGPDVTFTGKGQPGETVEITDADGNPLGETVVKEDGTWELVVTIPEGGSIVVEAGDQKVEIKDLTVVAPLVVTSPKTGDTLGTNGALFEGTGEPGEKIQITDADGVVIDETTVRPDGTWDLNVKMPEGAGSVNITAGGQKIVVDGITVEDDTADLVVTSPAEGAQVPLSGFTITGTAQPLAEVEVREAAAARAAGDLLGTATADAQGVWTLAVQLPVGDASLAITAPGKSATLNVTVFDDTPEEVAPLVVTSPKAGDQVGSSGVDFAGTGQPGTKVEIKDAGGKVIGETEVDGDGNWSLTVPAPVGTGNLSVVAGDETIVIEGVEVIDDTPAPVFEFAITSPAEGEVIGTGDIAFVGTGTPGATVVITDTEGNPLGDAIVDIDGTWTITIPAMPEGAQSIKLNDGEKDITFDFVVTEDVESTPLMDPLLGGTIAAGLLAFAGAFGLRRRFTATAE